MKKHAGLIGLLAIILFLFNASVYSQSLTIQWTSEEVKDSQGDALSLGSAIEVIMLPTGTGKSVPVFNNPFFINSQERLLGLQGGFDNPLPYVPFSIPHHPHTFFQLAIRDLPTLELGETLFLSLYLRVWDNLAFYNSSDASGSFNANGMYRGRSSLINPNKYDTGIISYYFETDIQTSEINSFDATLEFIFDISGEQANIPFTVAVPEPSAMLLAGFGFMYMLRKIRRK